MHKHRRLASLAYSAGVVCLALTFALTMAGGVSQAAGLAATSPTLGASAPYSVLGSTTVTCTNSASITGRVGVSPGSAITGFPSCNAAGGEFIPPNSDAGRADENTVFGQLDQTCTTSYGGVQDLTLVSPLGPGVYCANTFLLTGNLTLSGSGVWIFKAAADASGLTTSSGSSVTGGDPCNVWWRLVASGTLGTGSSFIGNIFAHTSLTLNHGANLNGRAMAYTGAVTLDGNNISGPGCATAPPSGTPLPSLPSYVDVSYPCSTDPKVVTVTVGMSAGVIVYGLGADITSATDTGANKIVVVLPFGHYAWHAVAPAGHYLVSVTSGAVDAFLCPSGSATAVPGAIAAPTAGSTAVPVLIPVTGADLAAVHALAGRQVGQVSLGLLGVGLVLLGIALRRRRDQ